MKNILVVGANGFTGRRILNDLSSQDYSVTGCSLHDDILPGSGYQFLKADIRIDTQIKSLFETVKPEIVINTSAISVPDYCETHNDEAFQTNVTAVRKLARYCNDYGSRFIHLSTDFVFDGNSDKLYTEEDTPSPVNYYGITKLEAEKSIESISANYSIARVVVVYGNSFPGQHGNIVQLVADKLRKKETIRVVSDQWRTPTFVGDISQGIEKLICNPLTGIFHICGGECMTIADIAYRVAEYLQLDSSLIIPVTTKEMKESTPRPRFSALSIRKAITDLGYKPRTLEEGLKEMYG